MKRSIRETWIEEGRATLLPSGVSAAFGDYINTLPWVGSTLEWSRLEPFTKIDVAMASNEEVLEWTKLTALGRHSHMALCFSPKEPCLVVKLEEGMRHLDELFWSSPGISFCFGVDVSGDEPQSSFADLLQYGAGDFLFARGLST
jgi:hypothetical protein